MVCHKQPEGDGQGRKPSFPTSHLSYLSLRSYSHPLRGTPYTPIYPYYYYSYIKVG